MSAGVTEEASETPMGEQRPHEPQWGWEVHVTPAPPCDNPPCTFSILSCVVCFFSVGLGWGLEC